MTLTKVKFETITLFNKHAVASLQEVNTKLMNLQMFNNALEEYKSNRVELPVSDDFCGDCRGKFLAGENRITGGTSTIFGEYYSPDNIPICDKCADKRYEYAVAEYESKNSR